PGLAEPAAVSPTGNVLSDEPAADREPRCGCRRKARSRAWREEWPGMEARLMALRWRSRSPAVRQWPRPPAHRPRTAIERLQPRGAMVPSACTDGALHGYGDSLRVCRLTVERS